MVQSLISFSRCSSLLVVILRRSRRISSERSFTSFRMTGKAWHVESIVNTVARPFKIMLYAALGIVLGDKAGLFRNAGNIDGGMDVHRRSCGGERAGRVAQMNFALRSEEHTSELQ